MLGVPVICADTAEHARWLAGPSQLSFVRLRQGRPTQLPTPEEAAEYMFTPFERELLHSWVSPLVAGEPERCAPELRELADRTGADELMLTTMVHGHVDRLRSYELVADAFELSGDGSGQLRGPASRPA